MNESMTTGLEHSHVFLGIGHQRRERGIWAVIILCSAMMAAEIVGACVIASWSYGLVRDTGAILIDVNPDPQLTAKLREIIERDGDQVVDLHLWRVGPGHLAAILTAVTNEPRTPQY